MEKENYYDVKITVLKRLELSDIHKEYAAEDFPLICKRNKEGDEYISKNCNMPSNFCLGAWKVIKDKVLLLASGKNSPYVKQEGLSIQSCNDGLHPVIYKLERII
ncbi:TIGR04076 family protein [uncultured Clostridium sp.]|uniref:TIGR04076 family protein n=1 Tax=uncultured Clostridium sp. TaxID=59620 RepID=UPI0028EA871E|nr:TIGR04076 family protein [uncultured Clostridium sp.]